MDKVDEAQQLAEDRCEDALAARRRRPPAIPSAGYCIDCGTPIAPKRLAVCPTARRCLDCQERYERESRE